MRIVGGTLQSKLSANCNQYIKDVKKEERGQPWPGENKQKFLAL